ncbi:uridine kinase [candidate division KSB1 bacterium]
MLTIGIAGGSGCGKTTVVNKIIEQLPKDSVAVISQDAYYWDSSHIPMEERKKINFDHPSSIEFELLVKHIDDLQTGNSIEMPIYSYISCTRSAETIGVHPTEVLIVEGILIYTNDALCKRINIKTFVDTDPDDRLIRIIHRDIEERGRTYKDVLKHYETFVKPMHLQFIEPTKRLADIIIPQGGRNQIAIDVLTSRIKIAMK